jgi:hypothetical protein
MPYKGLIGSQWSRFKVECHLPYSVWFDISWQLRRTVVVTKMLRSKNVSMLLPELQRVSVDNIQPKNFSNSRCEWILISY